MDSGPTDIFLPLKSTFFHSITWACSDHSPGLLPSYVRQSIKEDRRIENVHILCHLSTRKTPTLQTTQILLTGQLHEESKTYIIEASTCTVYIC